MTGFIPRLAVGLLAAWLVLLSGVVYPQLTAHAAQHAHHSAATHATALCSWLCAAGQAAENVVSPAPAPFTTASPAVRQEYVASDFSPVSSDSSRGPPPPAVSR
ncbi:MAG TPA: hypothetical protein VKP13_15630 [Nitrospira sp.]|nr:hypothetical protein [Nitrospira sp.]